MNWILHPIKTLRIFLMLRRFRARQRIEAGPYADWLTRTYGKE